MAPWQADEEECGYLWSRGFDCNEFKLGKLFVKHAVAIFFKLSTLCVLAVNRFVLFQLNTHNMLYIYRVAHEMSYH